MKEGMAGNHLDPLELHTVNQVCALTKRSRSGIYKDIAAGRLHIVKLGRSTRIPRAELERYLAANGFHLQ
jgi:excisionase family DNA binding protein